MLLSRFAILVVIGYAAGYDAPFALASDVPAHHAHAVLSAPAHQPQPPESLDVPVAEEEDEDLLQSHSDCTGTSASLGALSPVLAPSPRASSLERPLSLSRPAQLLYSLRRLRI
jgi:hypothetical protein